MHPFDRGPDRRRELPSLSLPVEKGINTDYIAEGIGSKKYLYERREKDMNPTKHSRVTDKTECTLHKHPFQKPEEKKKKRKP
jgi:hypothetical protein